MTKRKGFAVVDGTKWDPYVTDDGIVLCRRCDQSWSGHTMGGDCPDHDEEGPSSWASLDLSF